MNRPSPMVFMYLVCIPCFFSQNLSSIARDRDDDSFKTTMSYKSAVMSFLHVFRLSLGAHAPQFDRRFLCSSIPALVLLSGA